MKGLIEGEGTRAGSYYIPYAQAPKSNIGLAVRTAGQPADITNAIQRALATVDPELKPFDVFTLSERVELSLNQRRTPMLLSLAFGLVALLLASVGHVRRAGVPGRSAHARDRHPHGARERPRRHHASGAPRGSDAR